MGVDRIQQMIGKVCRLADSGMTYSEIAEKVSIPVERVQKFLEYRKERIKKNQKANDHIINNW